MSSEITEVNEMIIRWFGNILSVLNYTESLDYTKFGEYAHETARLFVDTYEWYDMPPTVHKVLIHGSEFIRSSLLSLGQSFNLLFCNNF